MLRPQTESELAAVIQTATGPLKISGGGTRPVGQTDADTMLSTSALSGITLYDPGALTLVAQAGTPVAEIEAALAAEGQMLPFEPMDHRGLMGTSGVPTIGGVVATNASGPRRLKTGACRDSLIGVRYVDGQGAVIKNGGRVMKNVTGYDLVKLMAGSYGTLGVMSEVSFKVLPRPQATAVLMFEGLSDAAAIACMADAMGSPFDVSGTAHTPSGANASMTVIRLEGLGQSVAYRRDALAKTLRSHGTAQIETDADRCHEIWTDIRDVVPLHDQSGDIWRVSVMPSDGPRVVQATNPTAALYDWQGGLVWLAVESGTDVRSALADIKGHATCLRGAAPTFHPEPAPLAKLSAGLRAQFDPRGILNPGLMS